MVAILDFYFQVTDFKIETPCRLRIALISSRSWFVPRHGGFDDMQLNVSFSLTLEMTDVCLMYPDLPLFR